MYYGVIMPTKKQFNLDDVNSSSLDDLEAQNDHKGLRAILEQALAETRELKQAQFKTKVESALESIGAPKVLAKYSDSFKDVDLSNIEDVRTLVTQEFGIQVQGTGSNSQTPAGEQQNSNAQTGSTIPESVLNFFAQQNKFASNGSQPNVSNTVDKTVQELKTEGKNLNKDQFTELLNAKILGR
jgi:ribosomal protein L29